MPTISEQFAEFATGEVLKRDRDLASRMRVYALDTLAVMLAGSVAPSSAIAARTLLAAAGKGKRRCWPPAARRRPGTQPW